MVVGFKAVGGADDDICDVFNTECPGRPVLDHVTNRWGIMILAALYDGPLRFYLLRDRIGGITEKMLSQNLRQFVRDGLVAREVVATTPPSVSYQLTPLGRGLAKRMQGVVDWIKDHIHEILDAQRQYDADR